MLYKCQLDPTAFAWLSALYRCARPEAKHGGTLLEDGVSGALPASGDADACEGGEPDKMRRVLAWGWQHY